MPATHGALIGFIELENGLSRDGSFEPEDTTIWQTLSRLGATASCWDDWDTPPGGPQDDSSRLSALRFLAAPKSNDPFTRAREALPPKVPPAQVLPASLEANRRQLLDDLTQATVALTKRIARQRHGDL